jgi:small GTP-binding protein
MMMRQKFDSYDDYRQAIDGVINRCELAREQEKLRSELLKIIAWADKNNIPQDRLPRDTEELCNLDALYLNDLKLTHLPDWIGKLSQLTELRVSDNQLTHLPDSIGNLTNLRRLNIHDNPLVVRYELYETVYTNDIINKIKAFESKREKKSVFEKSVFVSKCLKG